ncbi:MAG TPA: ROK family protein [Burkholderiales bacterium]|nr:ROK family protein [Burkholderiales bacterium]
MTFRIGVDLGGTKTEIIALDASGRERLRRREPTPRHAAADRDYAAKLDLIAELVQYAEGELAAESSRLPSIGIGTPGAISSATGRIKNSNSTSLIGQPFKEDIQRRLGRTVRVANDANCFALSEAADGAGVGAAVVFGVILGTGVGGGIVVHGRVLDGVNGVAGEWGHNPLPLPEPGDLPLRPCYCGRAGCIETYLSGPALERDHALAASRLDARNNLLAPSNDLLGAKNELLNAAAIAARAEAGDAACEATLARYERRLARALATVINLLDPDVIVLGGGLSNLARLYRNVPRLWGRHVFSDRVDTRLLRNVHGDSSGVRGAAWLWPA